MYKIRPEGPLDGPAIEALLDLSFGIDRQRKISYRFRVGREPEHPLSLVAHDHDGVVGAIRYWRMLLDDEPVLLLGPLAIDPRLRGRGIGRALVHQSLARAALAGFRLVFLVGDPAYYRQFGFFVVPREIVMMGEDPERVQWLGLDAAVLPEGTHRLCRWRTGGLLGRSVEPGEQRLADRRNALVDGRLERHLAYPCSDGSAHAGFASDIRQGVDQGADTECYGATPGQPREGLAFDAQPKSLAGIL